MTEQILTVTTSSGAGEATVLSVAGEIDHDLDWLLPVHPTVDRAVTAARATG
jgi:hypothetical protein